MPETCSPRKIGPKTKPLGSGVSKSRRGGRRTTFFALVFQLGVACSVGLKNGHLGFDWDSARDLGMGGSP